MTTSAEVTTHTEANAEEKGIHRSQKEYKTPVLTHYGGIASLVLGVPGAGADVPGPPFAALS